MPDESQRGSRSPGTDEAVGDSGCSTKDHAIAGADGSSFKSLLDLRAQKALDVDAVKCSANQTKSFMLELGNFL